VQPLDFAGLMESARREGWALVILDFGVDTTTPSGEMDANVMTTFAQFERRLIGQRTKDALAVKKRAGVKLGRPLSVDQAVVKRIANERNREGHCGPSPTDSTTRGPDGARREDVARLDGAGRPDGRAETGIPPPGHGSRRCLALMIPVVHMWSAHLASAP
jgi:hypothetical protein